MKFRFLLALIFVVKTAYSQFSYELSVTVPKELNMAKVYITIPKDNQAEALKRDTTVVKNNSFHFEGEFDRPCYHVNLSVSLKSKRYFYSFVLDSGLNTLNLVIRPGTPYLKNTIPLVSESNVIKKKLNEIFYETTSRHANRQTKEFNNDVQISQIEFLKKYPGNFYSLSSLYVFSLMESSPSRDSLILKTLDAFDKNLQESALGIKLRREKNSSIAAAYSSRIGNKVGQFKVRKADGASFSNNMLAGHPYIIAFSATWCYGCQQKLPELINLYKKYIAKGLKVIYFNLDDNMLSWKKHIEKHNLTWINVSERTKFRDSEIARKFHVYAIPTYILINKEGMIIYNQIDPDINKLEEYIKKAIL